VGLCHTVSILIKKWVIHCNVDDSDTDNSRQYEQLVNCGRYSIWYDLFMSPLLSPVAAQYHGIELHQTYEIILNLRR